MSTVSVASSATKIRRRRHSTEFKAQVVAACRQPGASLSRVALDHDLNANLVRRWVRDADTREGDMSHAPGFLPLALPNQPPAPPSPGPSGPETLRLELPSLRGTVVLHWPMTQADQCLAWLQGLLR